IISAFTCSIFSPPSLEERTLTTSFKFVELVVFIVFHLQIFIRFHEEFFMEILFLICWKSSMRKIKVILCGDKFVLLHIGMMRKNIVEKRARKRHDRCGPVKRRCVFKIVPAKNEKRSKQGETCLLQFV